MGGWPGHCAVVIDTSRILQYAERYKAIAICGIRDPQVDAMEDERITVSDPFTIVPGVIEMRSTHQNKPTDATPGIPVQVWHVIALLLKNVPAEKIHKLSDVQELGGKLIGTPG